MTTSALELRIEDALDVEALPEADLRIFETIRDLLKSARRTGSVRLHERRIVVLESTGSNGAKPKRRAAAARNGRR